jgi:hypothetical protein
MAIATIHRDGGREAPLLPSVPSASETDEAASDDIGMVPDTGANACAAGTHGTLLDD